MIALLGMFSSCQQDAGDTAQSAQGAVVGSAMPAVIPDNSRFSNVLQRNFWVIEYYIPEIHNKDKFEFNKGRWFRFLGDGTYEYGHWTEKQGSGTWFLRQGENYPTLRCDSATNDKDDVEYQIQGLTADQNTMSWVRTKNFGVAESASIKIINLLSMPTREQFGVKEAQN